MVVKKSVDFKKIFYFNNISYIYIYIYNDISKYRYLIIIIILDIAFYFDEFKWHIIYVCVILCKLLALTHA